MNKREFEIFFRINYPRLRKYAKKFVDDSTADDLLQDVFLKFWNNKKDDGIINPEAYIFISLRNACYNHLKKEMLQNRIFTPLYVAPEDEYLYSLDFLREEEYKSINEQLTEELQQKLELLPPKCKQVFMMSRFQNLKNREVAEKLGISEKVVEKHITRAFKILRKHLLSKN